MHAEDGVPEEEQQSVTEGKKDVAPLAPQETIPTTTPAVIQTDQAAPLLPSGGSLVDKPPPPASLQSSDDKSSDDKVEEETTAGPAPLVDPNLAQSDANNSKTKTLNQVLLTRLKNAKGKELIVAVLSPIDQSQQDLGEYVRSSLMKNLEKFGHESVLPSDITPAAIDLENFRSIILKTKSDILLISVIKSAGCELFLFDKRTPYQIYFYSQDFPEEFQGHPNRDLLEAYLPLALRRLLYSFVQKESFEMPREITTATLRGEEIPYWIARPGLVTLVNHDTLSNIYGSVTMGGSLGIGLGTTSSVFGIQTGFRIADDYYLEASLESFTYNSFGLSLKHAITFPDTPMKIFAGMGISYLFSNHAIGFDAAYLPTANTIYFVPSMSIVFPVVEVYLKFASELFISPVHPGVFLTLGPGLFMHF